jgi:hypothetical protein
VQQKERPADEQKVQQWLAYQLHFKISLWFPEKTGAETSSKKPNIDNRPFSSSVTSYPFGVYQMGEV